MTRFVIKEDVEVDSVKLGTRERSFPSFRPRLGSLLALMRCPVRSVNVSMSSQGKPWTTECKIEVESRKLKWRTERTHQAIFTNNCLHSLSPFQNDAMVVEFVAQCVRKLLDLTDKPQQSKGFQSGKSSIVNKSELNAKNLINPQNEAFSPTCSISSSSDPAVHYSSRCGPKIGHLYQTLRLWRIFLIFITFVSFSLAQSDIQTIEEPVTELTSPDQSTTFFYETTVTTRFSVSSCRDVSDFPLTITFERGTLDDSDGRVPMSTTAVNTNSMLQYYLIQPDDTDSPPAGTGIFVTVETTPRNDPYEIRVSEEFQPLSQINDDVLREVDIAGTTMTLETRGLPAEVRDGPGQFNLYIDRASTAIEDPTVCFIKANLQNQNTEAVERFTLEDSDDQEVRISLTGLSRGTAYFAYLIYEDQVTGEAATFSGYQFQTLGDGTDEVLANCEEVSNLNFCSKVDYRVPIPTGRDAAEVSAEMDSYAEQLHQNFDALIQQYNCEENEYSIVRNCSDCRTAYKEWVCSMMFPRCVGSMEFNPMPEFTVTETELLPFHDFTPSLNVVRKREYGIQLEDEFLRHDTFYQLLPCVDVCYDVVRSCPWIYNFTCPFRMFQSPIPFVIPADYGIAPGCMAYDRASSYIKETFTELPGLDEPFQAMESQVLVTS